jgi:hypothetical protein
MAFDKQNMLGSILPEDERIENLFIAENVWGLDQLNHRDALKIHMEYLEP